MATPMSATAGRSSLTDSLPSPSSSSSACLPFPLLPPHLDGESWKVLSVLRRSPLLNDGLSNPASSVIDPLVSTGAFVTHCGWSSVLEAASAGEPMLCWPQYAEQRLNKVFVVDEMKVRVVMEGYDEELVKAVEVETKVRLVMESEEGEKLRDRLALAKQKAAEALADGGPSQMAFAEFLKDLKLSK